MFSPNPAQAQEPVTLYPGCRALVLHFKPWSPPPGRLTGQTVRRNITNAKIVRFKVSEGEVQVSFNQDPHSGAPAKHFSLPSGEYAINSNIDLMCFYSVGHRPQTIYLEIGTAVGEPVGASTRALPSNSASAVLPALPKALTAKGLPRPKSEIECTATSLRVEQSRTNNNLY